jgi:hypothetical protein
MVEKPVDRAMRTLEAPAIPNKLVPELAVDPGRRDGERPVIDVPWGTSCKVWLVAS